MAEKIKVKIILGSTRQGRFGDKPATWLYGEMQKEQGVDVELLDLKDYPMPFFEEPASPAWSKGYTNPIVKKWSEKIKDGDAFIIVTPEYNHGYPAVLKNSLDVLYNEWVNKPVGFLSYGSVGGSRAIEQLRSVVIELQMAPIRVSLHVPHDVYMSAMDKTAPADPAIFEPMRKGQMGDRVAAFFNQLVWWAKALKTAREAGVEK